jgi:hypothetical protein
MFNINVLGLMHLTQIFVRGLSTFSRSSLSFPSFSFSVSSPRQYLTYLRSFSSTDFKKRDSGQYVLPLTFLPFPPSL